MRTYVCMHCRKELYKEDEEEKECEDHPEAPLDFIIVENEVEE